MKGAEKVGSWQPNSLWEKNLSVGALEKKSWFSKEEVFLGDSATIFADAAAIF